MRNTLMRAVVVAFVFFIGTCLIIALDSICIETTGYGGKLVLDVEKTGLFN